MHTGSRWERGIALLITLLATVALVTIVAALVPGISTETAIVANHRRAVRTLYAAEAAAMFVAHELQQMASWDAILDGRVRSGLWVTGGGSADLETMEDMVAMTRGLRRSGSGVTRAGAGLNWRLSAQGPMGTVIPDDPSRGAVRVAVWLARDPAVSLAPSGTDVVALHAAAVGLAGAHRAIQIRLVRLPPVGPAGTGLPSIRISSWRVVR